ncbi:hypothetical protein N499_0377A, partial [Wolbachia pipientis wVitA]
MSYFITSSLKKHNLVVISFNIE